MGFRARVYPRLIARVLAAVLLFLGTVGEANHALFHTASLAHARYLAGTPDATPGLWAVDLPCALCALDQTLVQTAQTPSIPTTPAFIPLPAQEPTVLVVTAEQSVLRTRTARGPPHA